MKEQSLDIKLNGFFIPCDLEDYEDIYLVGIPGQVLLLYSTKDVKADALYDPDSLEILSDEISKQIKEIQKAREEGLLTDFSVSLRLIQRFIENYKKEKLMVEDYPPSREYVLSLTELMEAVGLYP